MNKKEATTTILNIQNGSGVSRNRFPIPMRSEIATHIWNDGKFTLGIEHGYMLALMDTFDIKPDEICKPKKQKLAVPQLRKGMKIKFKGDIRYGQDMSFYQANFRNTIFTFVEKHKDGLMVFKAPGYGATEDYGNGKIYVSKKYRGQIVKA